MVSRAGSTSEIWCMTGFGDKFQLFLCALCFVPRRRRVSKANAHDNLDGPAMDLDSMQQKAIFNT